MYLPWKLTFQKINLKKLIIIIACLIIVIILINVSDYSCKIQHMTIINEIASYENSFDPEFCESLVEKIYSIRDSCNIQIEILDCS